MLFKPEQINNHAIHKYSKKQKSIVARSSLIAGIGLVCVAAIGYLFYYLTKNNEISINTLDVLTAIGLIMTLVCMVIFSFMRQSFLKYAIVYPLYIFSAGIGFSSLFALFSINELLMIFGVAGITMVVSAILGFLLPTSIIGSLVKFSSVLMIFLFIFSLCFSLIAVFSFGNDIMIWSIVVTVIMAFVCISYNIYTFHAMSKMQEFQNEEIDSKNIWLISLLCGFSLLVSVVQIIWIIARLYYYFK